MLLYCTIGLYGLYFAPHGFVRVTVSGRCCNHCSTFGDKGSPGVCGSTLNSTVFRMEVK